MTTLETPTRNIDIDPTSPSDPPPPRFKPIAKPASQCRAPKVSGTPRPPVDPEALASLLERCPPDLLRQAAETLGLVHIAGALWQFDTELLSARMKEKPELYFDLLDALCNLARLGLDREKFEWKKKLAEQKALASIKRRRPTIKPDSLPPVPKIEKFEHNSQSIITNSK